MGSRRGPLLWVAGGVLALALAGAAATLVAEEPPPVREQPARTDPATSTTGTSSAVDVSELPRPTGWIVFPVRAEVEANVVVHVDVDVRAPEADVAAALAFLADPNGTHGEPELSAAGDVDGAHRSLEANHDGRGLACCPDDDEGETSFAFGAGATLDAGETAYLGLVVVNASEGSSLSADVDVLRSAEPGGVSVGQPRTGTAARAVDLVEEAQRSGTNARYGTTQVGAPGEAEVTSRADRSTFAFLEVDLADDGQAELELAMPGGPGLGEELGAGARGEVAIAADAGDTRATLAGLGGDEPGELAGSGSGSEARLVLADVPLPIRAVDRSLDGPGEGRPSPVEVHLTDGELPAETSWFLAPLEVPEASPVHLQVELAFDEDPSGSWAALPIVADAHGIDSRLYGDGHEERVRASVADREATCCPILFQDGAPGGSVSSGFHGASPEEPIYVGLVAANWSSAASFSVFAKAQGSRLEVGSVATGTEVAFLDLFDEAATEPSARVGDERLVGDYEDLQRSWSPQETGLVAVRWDLEDARGDVAVELANGTRLDTSPSQGTEGRLFAAHGGSIELSFEEARRTEGDAQALAVVADLPLPREDVHLERDDA